MKNRRGYDHPPQRLLALAAAVGITVDLHRQNPCVPTKYMITLRRRSGGSAADSLAKRPLERIVRRLYIIQFIYTRNTRKRVTLNVTYCCFNGRNRNPRVLFVATVQIDFPAKSFPSQTLHQRHYVTYFCLCFLHCTRAFSV